MGWGDLILPQSDVPGFVDSHRKPYPLLEMDAGEVGGRRGKQDERRERELGLVCEMRKDCFKK